MEKELATIGETDLKWSWLGEVIRAATNVPGKHALRGWEASRLGEGQGFLSHIYKAALVWEPPHPALPASVVIKVPTMATIEERMDDFVGEDMDEEERKAMEETFKDSFLPIAHGNECSFYQLMAAKSVVPTPRFFYARKMGGDESGVIVMEDLSASVTTVNIGDGYRLAQLRNIFAHVGRLHAYASEHRSEWEEKFPPQPKESFKEWPKMFDFLIKGLDELHPTYFQGKLPKLEWAFQPDYVYEAMNHSHEKLGLAPALCHGDLWSNNILFPRSETAENGAEDSVAAFIDWQVVHAGNPAEDLARVICTCASTQIRREHLDELLGVYHESLCAGLGEGKAPPYSLAEMRRAYLEVLPFACLFFVMGIPVMTATPKLIGEGAAKERRVDALALRTRDLLDDVIALYPDGAASGPVMQP